MFANLDRDIRLIQATLFDNLHFTVGVIVLLLLIHLMNKASGGKLNYFGIIPRHIMGLPGIVCAPFLHGNFNHLFFNAIPLFSLMNMLLIYGYPVLYTATITITVLSGVATWLFGRYSIHLGSSSVVLGYFGFLSIHAYLAPSFMSLLLIILCLYYFGGLVAALVPTETKGVSVEGHIFGFLAGIASYYLLPYTLPYFDTFFR